MLSLLCKHAYANTGLGGGFTAKSRYQIVALYKNPGRPMMLNLIDDEGDTLQLPLHEVERIFDLRKGTSVNDKETTK